MDDEDSIHSASTQEQINFWSLTGTFMLKLVAMGITIFTLPYNEWIIMNSGNELAYIRGIGGSDCVTRNNGEVVECIRWADTDPDSRSRFWSKNNVNYEQVTQPSSVYGSLYYLVLCQIALFIMDLGATLVMCCRYKSQHRDQTCEKRLSLLFSATILGVYIIVSFSVAFARYDFTGMFPTQDACLGSAFRLFVLAAFLFLLGAILIMAPQLFLVDETNTSIAQRIYKTSRDQLCFNRSAESHRNTRSTKEEGVRLQRREPAL
ncbi:hypothetical protein DdX_02190 [Ditylenchus destructor]|uniref:Uncharacterized protein n=1 Tax=Ditylenchus destructor TaxID=166010 RepID=A0AAD4NGW4_9BILA|nr:hypothetical protein DdX_02190 [Ditylenchus destructor]